MVTSFGFWQGMWWLPSAAELETLGPLQRIALPSEDEWSTELLRLAAKQRMNTDVRRAVFCIVMGSEDYVDASERLLRLPLKVVFHPSDALLDNNKAVKC